MAQIADYNFATDKTRSALWKMLNEAWGFFTGSIGVGDIHQVARLKESQFKFYPGGHSHVGNSTQGSTLAAAGIFKRHFDLQELDAVWGNYYDGRIYDSDVYVVLAGSGTCPLTNSSTTTGATLWYGTVLIDYNPYDLTGWATTQPCQLHLREITGINTSAPFNTNWTLFMAYPTPVYANVIDKYLKNSAFGFDTGATSAPYLRFVASTTTSGTLTFDYKVVLRSMA